MNQTKVRGRRCAPQSRPDSRRSLPLVARRSAWLYSGAAQLTLELALPGPAASCAGWVILARAGNPHPADALILPALHQAGFATLSVDLLTLAEARQAKAAFDTPLLTARLLATTRWLALQPEARGKRLAYLAGGTAAGAAFCAAAQPGGMGLVAAVVSLNGRADLASAQLGAVAAPSLLVVNRRDRLVLAANRDAARRLNPSSRLVVAPSFRYLRYALREPGALDALLSVEWLAGHLAGVALETETRRPSLRALLDAWPSHGRAAAAATVLALLATLSTAVQPAVGAANLTLSGNGGTLTYLGAFVGESLTVAESSDQTTDTLTSNVAISPDTVATAAGCNNVFSNQVTCPASGVELNVEHALADRAPLA